MLTPNIYWETKPVFSISKYLGVAPFNSKFKLSIFGTFFSILILTLTFGDCTFLVLHMEKVNYTYKFSTFSLILERFQLLIVVFSVAVCVIKALFNSRQLSLVMESISDVDKNLNNVGLIFQYGRRFPIFLTYIRLFLLFNLFVGDLYLFNVHQTFGMLLVEYITMVPLVIGNLVQIQFIVLLNSIQKRLNVMTSHIKGRNIYFKKSRTVETFVVSYNTLADACSTLNSLYSPQILIILTSIFMVTTANLYHVIERIQSLGDGEDAHELRTLGILSYRMTVRSLEVWVLVSTCCNTSEKLQDFTNAVYQMILESNFNESMKLQMHITMQKRVTFTAYGFFPLDYTLVHSMIAAATTYLVILVQFSSDSSSGQKDK